MHYKTVRLSQFFDGDEITFTYMDKKTQTGTVRTVLRIGNEWWYSVWLNNRTIIVAEDSIIGGKSYKMYEAKHAWKGLIDA